MFTASVTTQSPSLAQDELLATPINKQAQLLNTRNEIFELLHKSSSLQTQNDNTVKYKTIETIAVDNRQSGPRPEPRLLRQATLEALTNSARTDSPRRVGRKRISGDNGRRRRRTASGDGGVWRGGEGAAITLREVALPEILFSCSTHCTEYSCGNLESSTCVTLNGSGIQLAVGPQPLWLRDHNSGPAQRIMVKRLATSPHDPLGITDSVCK
ncbi:hypothetical protein F511_28354 [Dorcoceras hygrometricum]|uniref:Uncharacterized protein n=1 Tax=Dorcoceras hygrometricum TaxID=472368 RepID=A0A2Z7BI27_9LAMI|nr:hypothetical protein F511_28354 [Dorcoceras hygrometricum]